MPNKEIKLKFNNFKPFGENYQEISIKPITLIYGPNSAGKSSLIDALLYYEHLQLAHIEELGDPDYLNVENKYFAGDKVDLGGFKNFVHQKDTSKTINYVTILKDRNSFDNFIPEFENIEMALNHLTNDYIDNNFFYNQEFIENKLQQKDKNILTEEEQENDSFYKIMKMYQSFLDESMSEKNLWHYFKNAYSRKKNKLDKKNKNINYAIETYCIEKYIDYLYDIMSIVSIKTKHEVLYDESGKLYTKFHFYINNDVLFNVKFGKYKTYYEVYNHSTFSSLIEIDKKKNNIIHFDEKNVFKFNMFNFSSPFIYHHLRSRNNYLETMVLNIMYQMQMNKSHKAIQYIGPLRLIPSKNDLFQSKKDETNDYKKLENKNLYSNYNNIVRQMIDEKMMESTRKFLNFIKAFSYNYGRVENEKNLILKVLKSIILIFNNLILLTLLIFLTIILLVLILPSLLLWKRGYNLYILFQKKINKFKNIFLNNVSLSTLGAVTSEKMWSDFISSNTIQKKVNQWLGSEKMKTQYSVHIEDKKVNWLGNLFGKKEKKQLSFLDKKNNTIVFPNEMGTGISQVLPILISSLTRKKSSIFIEQPELHLHPALQSELADEFISSIKKQKNEFIIETHSEHLLLRMMKRMRQTSEGTLENKKMSLKPEDINLLYVDTHEGETFILELELDEDGTLLDPWPGGFFDEGFNERFF